MFNFFGKKSKEKSKDHYLKLKVKEVVNETKDAISIVFENPEGGLSYKPGQFLTLILDINGQSVRRSYSFSSSPYVDANPSVTVKRVENGLVSNFLNDNIKVGDEISVLEPLGHFTLDIHKENKRHLVLFGGGSGITPLMSITKSVLDQEEDSMVSLVYCNRDIDSVIFKSDLDDMQTNDQGRLQVIHILDDAPVNWQGHSGMLNHDMLEKIMERIPDWGKDSTDYMMCGPEGMMENVYQLMGERGFTNDDIRKESFVSGTIGKEDKQASTADDTEHEVTINYEGQAHKVSVPADKPILEAFLDEGIDLPYSCQSGLCTACRCKKVSGEVSMDEDEGLSDSEIQQGYVLICVGHPKSDDVELEVG